MKVLTDDIPRFEQHLTTHGISFSAMTDDWIRPMKTSSTLYSVTMDKEDELLIKLAFPLVGCINFRTTMDKLKPR